MRRKNMTVYYLNVKITFCESIFKVVANQSWRPLILFAFSRTCHKFMFCLEIDWEHTDLQNKTWVSWWVSDEDTSLYAFICEALMPRKWKIQIFSEKLSSTERIYQQLPLKSLCICKYNFPICYSTLYHSSLTQVMLEWLDCKKCAVFLRRTW